MAARPASTHEPHSSLDNADNSVIAQKSSEVKMHDDVAGAGMKDGVAKQFALFCLVLQNIVIVFLMRYTQTVSRPGQPRYLTTVAVFATELLKLVSATVLVIIEERGLRPGASAIRRAFCGEPLDLLKLSVPGAVYAIQNNLLYIGLANLPGAVYSATYQLKTPFTAVCSVYLLGKMLTLLQWYSLVQLCIGVALLQMFQDNTKTREARGDERPMLGFVSVVGASVLSAIAGVVLEKLLKSGRHSIWVRNVQLAGVGAPMALAGAFWSDRDRIREAGLLQGFNGPVWLVVVVNALGGFAIAAVLRYADNIVKCFGAALAVVINCFVSRAIGEVSLNVHIAISVFLVVTASLLYGLGLPPLQSLGNRKVMHIVSGVLFSFFFYLSWGRSLTGQEISGDMYSILRSRFAHAQTLLGAVSSAETGSLGSSAMSNGTMIAASPGGS